MNIYRYCKPVEYNFDALTASVVYGILPSFFSDPYDSIFSYSLKELYNSLINNKNFVSLCALKINDRNYNSFENYKEYLTHIDCIFHEIKSQEHKSKVFYILDSLCVEIIDCIRNNHLVTCLSTSNSNELMWAHYADSGKGYVIEYESTDIDELVKKYFKFNPYISYLEGKSNAFGLKPVKYSKTREDGTNVILAILKKYLLKKNKDISINSFIDCDLLYKDKIGDFELTETLHGILLNKNKLWEYENEYRIILPRSKSIIEDINNMEPQLYDSGYSLLPHREIGSLKAKGIYLGEKIGASYKLLLITISKQLGIPIYQGYTGSRKQTYGVDFVMIKKD